MGEAELDRKLPRFSPHPTQHWAKRRMGSAVGGHGGLKRIPDRIHNAARCKLEAAFATCLETWFPQ